MKTSQKYDSFPRSIVAYRAFLFLSLLGVSIAIVISQTVWGGALYGLFVIAVLALQMTTGCSRCDYYHSRCDNGFSVLTRMFVKKKDDRPAFFGAAKRCLYPLMVVIAVPFGVSIWRLMSQQTHLQTVLLGAMITLFALIWITNQRVACPRCSMNDVCPLGKSVISRRSS